MSSNDMGENTIRTAGGVNPSPDAKKVNKRPFELKEKCQEFAADIYNVTSVAPKELRLSLCKRTQDLATELIHTVRLANACKLGSPDRKAAQRDAIEMIDRLNDLMPVMTKCRCVTPEQETALSKKLKNLKNACNIWAQKDAERLEGPKAK